MLAKTVKYFEQTYQTGWVLPENPNSELTSLLAGIVAFRIEVIKIDAKFKLSQKQDSVDRSNVIRQLEKINGDQSEVADYMKRVLCGSNG